MSILKYLVKQSNPTQDSSTAISLPVKARVSQSSIEEAECEDAHDMELVHSSSARRVADPPVNCWPVLRNLDVSVLLEVKTRAMSSPVLEIKMMLFQMFEFYLQNQTSQNLTFLGGVLASRGHSIFGKFVCRCHVRCISACI